MIVRELREGEFYRFFRIKLTLENLDPNFNWLECSFEEGVELFIGAPFFSWAS